MDKCNNLTVDYNFIFSGLNKTPYQEIIHCNISAGRLIPENEWPIQKYNFKLTKLIFSLNLHREA